jgi:hypothetical protein
MATITPVIRAVALLTCSACLAAPARSDSLRITHPEYAQIRDLHIGVMVSSRPTFPDRAADQLSNELKQEIVALLSQHGVRVHTMVDDGPPQAAFLNVAVEVAEVPHASSVAFVHTRVELREVAGLARLKNVGVCHRAVTWAQDDLRHVAPPEAPNTARSLVTKAVTDLLGEIAYASGQGRKGR